MQSEVTSKATYEFVCPACQSHDLVYITTHTTCKAVDNIISVSTDDMKDAWFMTNTPNKQMEQTESVTKYECGECGRSFDNLAQIKEQGGLKEIHD